MTKSKLLILAAAPALVLCSCAKKCSFEDFQKKVSEIEKAPKITEITVKGYAKSEGETIEVEKTTVKVGEIPTTEEAAKAYMLATVMAAMNVVEFAIVEDPDLTYYAGSTFKVKSEEATIEWDKYGNCTSIEGEMEGSEVDISASYTYAD